MNKIETYTKYAEQIANDDTHGYDQIDRWGNPNYDCSGLVITAVQQSGIPVKSRGATYTGNMLGAFLASGFEDVTGIVDRVSGKGMKRGDVLLSPGHHTAIYCGNGRMVDARINENGKTTGGKSGDQTGHEIEIHAYRNHPWTHVLRYGSNTAQKTTTSYKAKDAASSFNKGLAKSYKTTANLNMRHGAGTNKQIIVTLPKGTNVRCYGYYSMAQATKWLYVVAVVNNTEYTGFCSSAYLV